jgi:hypothetical protein
MDDDAPPPAITAAPSARPAMRVPDDRVLDGHTIFFTFTTPGYVKFVRNLHISLSRVEPRLASALVAFCPDHATARELRAAGVFAMTCDVAGLPDFADFDGSGFGRVVSFKYRLARSLLDQAEFVWWCDGDIVARRPWATRIDSLMAGTDCDLLMQYEWPKDVYNVGFWIARRGPAVDAMLAEMAEFTASADADDQGHFNDTHVGRGPLRLAALDPDEFMCGNRFFFRRLFRLPDARMLHFNYTVGRLNKQSLMMGHGCWYLDEPITLRCRARLRHLVLVLTAKLGVEDPETLVRDTIRAVVRTGRRFRAALRP